MVKVVKTTSRRNAARQRRILKKRRNFVAVPGRRVAAASRVLSASPIARTIESTAMGNLLFAQGLLNPSSKMCPRWPQPIPVPTYATSYSGSVVLQANGAGNLLVYLGMPPQQPALFYSNAAGLTSVSAWSTWGVTTTESSSTLTGNFAAFRVVSAELSVRDTNPVLNRCGEFKIASVPYGQITSSFTVMALRDAYYYTSGDNFARARAVALPMDTSAAEWASGTNAWSTPIIAMLGGVANGSYTVDYHYNFEAIPNAASTDLLATSPGAPGTVMGALSEVGRLVRSGVSGALGIARDVVGSYGSAAGAAIGNAIGGVAGGIAGGIAGGAISSLGPPGRKRLAIGPPVYYNAPAFDYGVD